MMFQKLLAVTITHCYKIRMQENLNKNAVCFSTG